MEDTGGVGEVSMGVGGVGVGVIGEGLGLGMGCYNTMVGCEFCP